MDPSIMKLLEEDEDETMHSGADVEAFTAALNRDIEGDPAPTHPSEADPDASQGNHQSSQLFSQWKTSSLDETTSQSQQELKNMQQLEQSSPEFEQKPDDAQNKQQEQVESSQGTSCLPKQQEKSADEHKERSAEEMPIQISQSTGVQIRGHSREQLPVQFSQLTGMHNSGNNTAQSTGGMPQKNQSEGHEQIPQQISQANNKQNSDRNHVATREADKTHNSNSHNSNSETFYSKLHAAVKDAPPPKQVSNSNKQVPFALLLPVILPQLDKDRAMQLQTLYAKLKKNEIPKEAFVRLMKGIVGDQMLRLAVQKLQEQPGSHHFQLQSQALSQKHHIKVASSSSQQFLGPHSYGQLNQKGQGSPAELSRIPTSAVKFQNDAHCNVAEGSAQTSRELGRPEGQVMPVSQMSSPTSNSANQERERSSLMQGLSKQQQQHFHFSQTSFPAYGSTGAGYHPHSGTNASTPVLSSIRPQSHDSTLRQVPLHQSMGQLHPAGSNPGRNTMVMPKYDTQSTINDSIRVNIGSHSNSANSSTVQQSAVNWQSAERNNAVLPSMGYVKPEPVEQIYEQQQKLQVFPLQGSSSISAPQVDPGTSNPGNFIDEGMPLEKQVSRTGASASATVVPSKPVSSSLATHAENNSTFNPWTTSTTSPAGNNVKTPPKRPSAGQKKPLEGSSPPISNKKQRVSGASSDQSIEQLNDVTAVSGVNLREEEEHLLSGPKEDNRVSEVSRRFVQEEEEKLILQRNPLQKKLAQIMMKFGMKSISSDVERCLSLCVEERLRGLISNLVRLSKQRVDFEKPRHRTFVTSDVRQQILLINRKAREECKKKQAEEDKLRKINDSEDNLTMDDDGRLKSLKYKEDDDKMRTTAANVAARAAVGGDDMLSKWQHMAEKARKKREGANDEASGSQPGKEIDKLLSTTLGRNARDNSEVERKSQPAAAASGATTRTGKNEKNVQTKVACNISVKDIISVLEREPQMSKSGLIYRLYERARADKVSK